MDFSKVIGQHIKNDASAVATIPVDREAATGFGIMQIDADRQIREFVEKPQEPDVIDSLRIPAETRNDLGLGDDEDQFLASMVSMCSTVM